MRSLPLCAVIFILLASVFYGAWRYTAVAVPCRTAEAYVTSLIKGDVDTASSLSVGSALYAASRIKENKLPSAGINKISATAAAYGNRWARVFVSVELSLQDGTVDAGFYILEMIKTDTGWKVISMAENDGVIALGIRRFIRPSSAEEGRKVFETYLNSLVANNWKASVQMLAGPARRSAELSGDILGRAPIIKQVQGLSVKPLWSGGESMILEFTYMVDGKSSAVAVEFLETTQGWKIKKITQC